MEFLSWRKPTLFFLFLLCIEMSEYRLQGYFGFCILGQVVRKSRDWEQNINTKHISYFLIFIVV